MLCIDILQIDSIAANLDLGARMSYINEDIQYKYSVVIITAKGITVCQTVDRDKFMEVLRMCIDTRTQYYVYRKA